MTATEQLALLTGAVAGAGLMLVVRAVWPRVPQLVSTVEALAGISPAPAYGWSGAGDGRWTTRLGARVLRRWPGLPGIRIPYRDLALLGVPVARYVGERVMFAVLGWMAPTLLSLLTGWGASVTIGVAIGVAPFLAVAASFIPDYNIAAAAKRAREDFILGLSAFADLVALQISSGTGTTQAVHVAASLGDSWVFTRLAEELRRAEFARTTPWDALRAVGTLLTSLGETLLGRALHPVEHTSLAAAHDAVTVRAGDPVLPQMVQAMLDPDSHGDLPAGVDTVEQLRADGRDVGHALSRLVFGALAGLFDRPSTVTFDPTLPMISLDVSRIGEDNPLIPLVMTCTSAWMESALRDPDGGKRWMVYDEAWKIMRQPALVRRMETQWRLSRAWGLANILAVHQLSDFAAVGDAGSEARARATALLALTSTRVIYRQPADQLAHTRTAMGLNNTEADLVPSLVLGRGLWRIGARALLVQHNLTTREIALFDTDARFHDPVTEAGPR